MIFTFVEWCQKSALSEAIRSQTWIFPSIEIVHITGLVLLFGSILVLNLRIFGFILKQEPVPQVAGDLARLTLAGLLIQIVSGPLLFVTSAVRFYDSGPFRVKLLLLVVALAYHFGVHRRAALATDSSTAMLKFSAMVAQALWFGVVLAGLGIELLA